MRLAIWQTQGFPAEPAANLAALERCLAQVAQAGSELLLCPELWLCGYNLGARLGELAEAADGAAANRIAELARRYAVAVCYGYAERHPDGDRPYLSLQLIDAQGRRLANYRKTHLFAAEQALFSAGDCLPAPVRLGEWRIGLLLGVELEYPEAVRSLALAGIDLLLVPSALTPEYAAVPRAVVPARALENQIFVAYCDRCGAEQDLTFLGGSCAVGPDGEALAVAHSAESLLLVHLDAARRAELAERFPYLAGRRPALYGALLES